MDFLILILIANQTVAPSSAAYNKLPGVAYSNSLMTSLSVKSDETVHSNRRQDDDGPVATFVLVCTELTNSNQKYDQEELISEIQKRLQIRLDEDVYIVIQTGQDIYIFETYQIKDRIVQHFLSSFSLQEVRRLDWDILVQYHLFPKVARRSDFKGALLMAVGKKGSKEPLRRQAFRFEDPNLQTTTSLAADTYLDLKTQLNFRVKIVTRKNLKDITLGLQDGVELDFTIFFIRNNLENAGRFGFLQPMLESKNKIFFQKRGPSSFRNAHFYPFQESLWMGLAVTWALVSLSLLLINLQLQESGGGGDAALELDDNTTAEVVWWMIALISMKSCQSQPSSYSLRSAFLTTCFLVLIMYGCYSAVILSSLTVPFTSVRNVDDLIRFKYKFTVHEKGDLFRVLEDLIVKKHLPQTVIRVRSEDKMNHLVQGQPLAIIAHMDSFFRDALAGGYTSTFICDNIAFTSVVDPDRQLLSSLALRKGSEFTEFFNYKIIKLMERGLKRRYLQEYQAGVTIACPPNDPLDIRPINLWDVVVPLVTLVLGCIIALLLGLLEVLKLKMCK